MDGKELQKKIAGILTTQGNVTVQQLARRLRARPHSIRYQLDKLVESRSLERAILINQRVLGYQVFNLFFDLPQCRAKKAVDFLKRSREVAWFTQNLGPRRYEMTVVVRDFASLSALFRDMGEETSTQPRDIIMAVEGEVTHWGLRFLTEGFSATPIAHFTTSSETTTIDDLDREVLGHFVSHDITSMAGVGPRLGVSPSTIKYRLDRLRVAGVISDETYFMRPQMAMFQAQLVLQLKSRSASALEHVTSACANHPHVEGLVHGVGNWDFKIVITAESLARLTEIEEELLLALSKHVLQHSLYIRDKIIGIRSGL